MRTVTQRALNQHTASVLAQVTDAGDIVVTERGEPRWLVTAFRSQEATLVRMEREGRYTPPVSVRVLRRDSRPLTEAAPLLDRVGILDVTRETHTVAESIERRIKTLDALHLATALLIGEPVTVASHETAMKTTAEHLGLHVTDPVDSS